LGGIFRYERGTVKKLSKKGKCAVEKEEKIKRRRDRGDFED